jgi:hypothetical protein
LYAHDLACLHLRSSQPASVTFTIDVGAGIKSPYDSLPSRRQTSRDFVPWRFSDADRISAWRVSSCRRPRNLHSTRHRFGMKEAANPTEAAHSADPIRLKLIGAFWTEFLSRPHRG